MKVYLNVPFEEKDDAKRMGARFDLSCKRWYVPDGTDSRPFKRWFFARMPSFEARKKLALQRHRERQAGTD